jgi:hypothetical protein
MGLETFDVYLSTLRPGGRGGDKFWFGPVGKVLDERDAKLRSQLGTVKDGSSELARLTAGAG